MAHEIEIGSVREQATFASRRQPAWHGLGTVCDEDFMYPSHLAKKAHLLGQDVRVENLAEPNDDGTSRVPGMNFSEDFFVTTRINPFTQNREIIEKVGERYEVITTDEMVELADIYSENYNASAETAGGIRNGRGVFLSLSLDSDIVIDPKGPADRIKNYLLLTNSFDGSIPFGGLSTPVRVVCQNTLNMAMHGTKQSFTIRHTKSAKSRLDEAKKAAVANAEYQKVFTASAEALYKTEVSDKKFWNIIEGFYGEAPTDDDNANRTMNWATDVAKVMSTWHGSTVAEVGIGRTGWGALNAISEAEQWLRTFRDGQAESFILAGAGLRDNANQKRNRLFNLVMDACDIKHSDLVLS